MLIHTKQMQSMPPVSQNATAAGPEDARKEKQPTKVLAVRVQPEHEVAKGEGDKQEIKGAIRSTYHLL